MFQYAGQYVRAPQPLQAQAGGAASRPGSAKLSTFSCGNLICNAGVVRTSQVAFVNRRNQMKYVTQAVLTVLAVGALSTPANAQWSSYAVGANGTEAQLQGRINQGVRDGSLTQGEAAGLQSKLNQIESMEGRFRSNGMNKYERRRIEARLVR